MLRQQPSNIETIEARLGSWNPAVRAEAKAQIEALDDALAFRLLAKKYLRDRLRVQKLYSRALMLCIGFSVLQLLFWDHLPWHGAGRHVAFLPAIMSLGLIKYLARLRPVWVRLPNDLPTFYAPLMIDIMEVAWGNRELSSDETSAYDGLLAATKEIVSRIDEETARSLTPKQFAWIRKEVSEATGLEDSSKAVAFLVGALLALAEGDRSSIPDAVHLARTHVSEQVRAAAAECARRLGSQDDLSFVSGQEATANAAKLRE